MILAKDDIQKIIVDNPGAKRIKEAIDYSKTLKRHMYGDKLDGHWSMIDGFEDKAMLTVRKKYSKSNKDLFARLSRPIDKVFTAKGGSVYYNLSDAANRKVVGLTSDVTSGLSIRKWIETKWKPHMLDDPFGIIFLELLPQQQAIQAKQKGKSFVYPVYKSISTVYDYLPNGNKLEYVVFELSNEDKKKENIDEKERIFRVVDDAFDYLVRRDGQEITILESYTLPNYFGEVPAMINSDIADPNNDNCFLSFFDEIIELAEHFLLKGSIKITHEFLHGFPKYAEFADSCNECNGTGRVLSDPCKACAGTGKKLMTKVSDAKMLEYPQSKDAPIIYPDKVAAYISPDKTYYEISTTEIGMLEDIMHMTLWGTEAKIKENGPAFDKTEPVKTATQVMDDTKPIADRLFVISEMAEKRHKFILDAVIRLNLSMLNYEGAFVSYGRRYMLEGPDVIWEKYNKARTSGSPQNVLDDLLNEYYEAKYLSDPISLEVARKLMYVEPFVHYTAQNLMGLNPDPVDYMAKLYFSEWLAIQPEGLLLTSTPQVLKDSLYTYTKDKKQPEKETVAA